MSVIKATDIDFQNRLKEQEKVIVKYYADWCGPCKLIAPKFKRFSDDERFKSISFLEVNAEKNPTARKLAGVDSLPFFAIFRNGEFVDGVSASNEEYVLSLLEKLN